MWRLRGLDTFSSEWYPLPGEFHTEAEARSAARERLNEREQTQPSESSGSKDGIQDRVYIVGPDGTTYRYIG